MLNADHGFYASNEFAVQNEKATRSHMRKSSGTILGSGMGAREVFGMENKQYVLDMA